MASSCVRGWATTSWRPAAYLVTKSSSAILNASTLTRGSPKARVRRDVGVEPARRGGDEVDQNRGAGALLLQLGEVALHPLDECLVGRGKIRAARIRGITAREWSWSGPWGRVVVAVHCPLTVTSRIGNREGCHTGLLFRDGPRVSARAVFLSERVCFVPNSMRWTLLAQCSSHQHRPLSSRLRQRERP